MTAKTHDGSNFSLLLHHERPFRLCGHLLLRLDDSSLIVREALVDNLLVLDVLFFLRIDLVGLLGGLVGVRDVLLDELGERPLGRHELSVRPNLGHLPVQHLQGKEDVGERPEQARGKMSGRTVMIRSA